MDERNLVEGQGLRRLSGRDEHVIDLMTVLRIRIVANAASSEALWAEFAKVAVAFGEGGDGALSGFASALADSLVVEEEKGFVALDGTAEGAAVLIAFQRFDGLRE